MNASLYECTINCAIVCKPLILTCTTKPISIYLIKYLLTLTSKIHLYEAVKPVNDLWKLMGACFWPFAISSVKYCNKSIKLKEFVSSNSPCLKTCKIYIKQYWILKKERFQSILPFPLGAAMWESKQGLDLVSTWQPPWILSEAKSDNFFGIQIWPPGTQWLKKSSWRAWSFFFLYGQNVPPLNVVWKII